MKKLFTFIILLTLQTLLTHGTLYSQWYRQQIPVNKPVTGIKFVDTLNGWASIGNMSNPTPQDTGYILHTTNGGINWLIQFSKISVQFSALAIINNSIGYASGDSINNVASTARLFKTTNGGFNWNNIPIPYNMFVSQLFFLNSDTGWEASGSGGTDVRLTTDGGFTWQVRTSGITSSTNCIFFLNYNTGYCGAYGNFYKTTNAGLSWNLLNTFSTQIQSIFFLNDMVGWAGLSPDTSDKVAFTTNGGINWTIQNIGSPYGFNILDIFFFDSNLGYACTGFNKICKTFFGGFPWGYQNDSTGTNRMSFTDSLHGWTGSLGISKTSNGGGQITYIGIKKISNQIPNNFTLYQNFPNPFNSQTTIRFSISKSAYVDFKIFDESGKELNPWIFGWEPNKYLQPGTHEFQFDGSEMASGAYFFQLIIRDENSNTLYNETIKMILLK